MIEQTAGSVHDLTAPLGPLLSDRAFQELLDTLFPRSPGKQKALRRLRDAMDAQGCVTLDGGIRGWQQALDCGLSQGRPMLEAMAAEGAITLDIVREPGGWIANIVVLAAFESPDPCGIKVEEEGPDPCRIRPAPTGEITAPHQDALNDSPDRSGIKPPHTPHVESHESYQQQQQNRARAQAEAEFPQTDRGLIRHLVYTHEIDLATVLDILRGQPDLPLAEWLEDLQNADDNPTRYSALGTVIHAWRNGRRVGKVRQAQKAAPAAPPGSSAPRSTLAAAVKRKLQEAPGRCDIEEAPDLSAEEREPWLQRFDAASPDERPDVLHEFWTWWGERDRARKLASAPPGPPRDPKLGEIWQAALGVIQRETTRQEFDTWFRGAVLAALQGGTATVTAASHLYGEGLENRYLALIRRALGDVLGHAVTVRIVARQAAAAAD